MAIFIYRLCEQRRLGQCIKQHNRLKKMPSAREVNGLAKATKVTKVSTFYCRSSTALFNYYTVTCCSLVGRTLTGTATQLLRLGYRLLQPKGMPLTCGLALPPAAWRKKTLPPSCTGCRTSLPRCVYYTLSECTRASELDLILWPALSIGLAEVC